MDGAGDGFGGLEERLSWLQAQEMELRIEAQKGGQSLLHGEKCLVL